MITLIGRHDEKKELLELLNSKKFEFVVVYGRRRVGKTFLVLNTLQNKKSLYYLSVDNNNLSKFKSEAELSQYADDWETLFKNISQDIVVIDEFQSLVKEYPEILSIIQKIIDLYWSKENKKLILVGSSISLMEKFTLSYKSPLYGRKTAVLELKPLSFFEIYPIFNDKNIKEIIEIYCVFGGIPLYLILAHEHKLHLRDFINADLKKKLVFF